MRPLRPFGSAIASFRRRPVRVRLAILSGLLTAVILVGFAAVVGRLVSDRLQDDFRDELRREASSLALNLRVVIDSADRIDVCQPIAGGPGCLSLAQVAATRDAEILIVNQAGDVAATSGPDPPALGEPRDGSVRVTEQGLHVIDARLPIINVEVEPLWVQYARSPASVNKTIGRLWLFLGGGVLVGTLLAGFAGMTVANRAMGPIAELTRTAHTIARTRDPSLRVPQPPSDDEVAELARTLDGMLRELDAARAEREEMLQRQREFIADASHELRTPLTSILANLELLEASLTAADDDDDRAATRSALRSSRRMSRLVADLLIIARADAGRTSERVSCDLARIAAEAVEEARPVAGDRTIAARIELAAPLHGNPDELHRMILNLLENAIRHTPEGTGVELELRREDGQAVLSIADDGPGLPEGMEEQVFGRFVRGGGPADRSGSNEHSTGLGLAIVRAVATAHGGDVSAGRSPAGGAIFTVALPLTADRRGGGD